MKNNVKLFLFTISVGESIPALSHTEAWISEFSLHFSEVNVYATHVSIDISKLPKNVSIVKLGGGNLLYRLCAVTKLFRLLPRLIIERKKAVTFFHMSTNALVIVGPFLKIMNIPIALWYSHKVAPKSLKVALPLADIVFSPTSKTFPLTTQKIHPTGHGLALKTLTKPTSKTNHRRKNSIVVLGRVAAVKRIENIIYAIKMSREPNLEVECIGPTNDVDYLCFLQELSKELGIRLQIRGPMQRDKLLDLMWSRSMIYSGTEGSVDKAPLEAAASGCFVVTMNSDLEELSGMKNFWEKTFVNQVHNLSLESKLNLIYNAQKNDNLRLDLIHDSRMRNDLGVLIDRISTQMIALKDGTRKCY